MAKRALLWTLAGVAAIVALGALFAPKIACWYIEKRYQGVHVGDADIAWSDREIVLKDVRVERDGVTANLKQVTADTEKNIRVEGGHVEVDLAKSKGSSSKRTHPSSIKVSATGLEVTIEHDGVTAELHGVSLDLTKVCFRDGRLTHILGTAEVVEGCVQTDRTKAHAKQVSIPIEIPFLIPKVQVAQVLVVDDVKVNLVDSSFEAAKVTMGPIELAQPKVFQAEDSIHVESSTVRVDHEWIATEPVTFSQVSVDIPKDLIYGFTGDVGVEVGKAKVKVDPFNIRIEGDAPCATWVNALPRPQPEALDGTGGNFSGNLQFSLALRPTPTLSMRSSCAYTCSASPIKELKQSKFTYDVYNRNGQLVERQTGRGSPGWVPITDMPPHLLRAFILLEDPGFESHRGVVIKALENSLKLDLEQGDFVRGGSTITMQLAKNLWLRRHKTLGRKAQEALLTFGLESCFRKDEILEFYANVVEFGPDLYGVGPAAKHYFGKSASELTVEESFYLASILPAPRKALAPDQGGLDKARRIMKSLVRAGVLSEFMLDEDPDAIVDGWEIEQ